MHESSFIFDERELADILMLLRLLPCSFLLGLNTGPISIYDGTD